MCDDETFNGLRHRVSVGLRLESISNSQAQIFLLLLAALQRGGSTADSYHNTRGLDRHRDISQNFHLRYHLFWTHFTAGQPIISMFCTVHTYIHAYSLTAISLCLFAGIRFRYRI